MELFTQKCPKNLYHKTILVTGRSLQTQRTLVNRFTIIKDEIFEGSI